MSQFLHPFVWSVRSLLLILRLKLLRLDLPRSAGLSLLHKWGPKKRSECLPWCVLAKNEKCGVIYKAKNM